MRNFITSTPGATFFQGDVLTFVVRKDYVEYVMKAGKGLYGVVNLLITDHTQVTLFCSWGNFFERVTKHEDPNKLFKMIERSCPTVIKAFTGQLEFSCITLGREDGLTGIALEVESDNRRTLMEIISDPNVLEAVEKLFSFNCDLYTEIQKSCPFEGWKKGLREI